jgi:hypothetical protein
MRTKYLVVSYERDADCLHYDVLFAESEEQAREHVQKLRNYCEGFDVLDMPSLERLTLNVRAETEREADAWMAELAADAGLFSFRMSYTCPNDGTKWQLELSCVCNDRCPTCDKEIEPTDVEDITRKEGSAI